MAVWIDPAIEFIVREAYQDMGTEYQDMDVAPLLTEETKLMVLVWNEGEITTFYNMEQQGVYVSVKFEPQIIGYTKRQVGRAMFDFENALIGGVVDDDGRRTDDPVAHHNVGGHPIRQGDMAALGLYSTYEPLTVDRPGLPYERDEDGELVLDDMDNPIRRTDSEGVPLWWPEHIVQKVTIEGTSIKFDPNIKAWRGRLFINAHIANAGFGGLG